MNTLHIRYFAYSECKYRCWTLYFSSEHQCIEGIYFYPEQTPKFLMEQGDKRKFYVGETTPSKEIEGNA